LLPNDPRAVFITGDLGFNSFERLRERLGRRFLNAGVAEQNMIGVSAGMALRDLRPWVYSITPFITFRCLEQIRNDLCLHNLPVRIVGNGAGYSYGVLGATHHALEDIAVLKALPNMTLFLPCSGNQVAACVHAADKCQGPAYLRLGNSGFATDAKPLDENPSTLTRQYRAGSDLTIVGVGQATQIVVKAMQDNLLPEGAAVFGIAKFPFDSAADATLSASIQQTGSVLVVDEHYVYGSLAESMRLAFKGIQKYQVLAPYYSAEHTYGSSTFQLKQAGVTPQTIGSASLELLQNQ
jgi:transketolase